MHKHTLHLNDLLPAPTGSVLGSDFNMSKLCMWTKNVLILEPGYESAYSPDVISIDDEGNVGMHGVGTSLFAELGVSI